MSSEMNAGTLEPETKTEESSKNGPGKSGLRWIAIGVVIALLTYGASYLLSIKNSGTSHEENTPETAKELREKLRKAEAEKAADPLRAYAFAPSFGTFEFDETAAGIEVPENMTATMELLDRTPVEFEFQINDVKVCEWDLTGKRTDYINGVKVSERDPAGKRGNYAGSASGKHTEKFKLKPGQAVKKMEVAFVIYHGPKPDREVWLAAAKKNGRIDIER